MDRRRNKFLPLGVFLIASLVFLSPVRGIAKNEVVELNGDQIEYLRAGQEVKVKGNVEMVKGQTRLVCDYLDFSRKTNVARAKGNVSLFMPQGEISGEAMTFNFKTMKGDFQDARIASTPYYGMGARVAKVDENLMVLDNGVVTTCDYDHPHYGIRSRRIEIYPGEKLVARGMRFVLGRIPILYLPRFTQSLKEKEPKVIFTPGYDKRWGMFLLSTWRYRLNDDIKGRIHLDAREKKDVAWGVDVSYKTSKAGRGTIQTYYMNERSITAKRFYRPKPRPTIERERFKVEWRHQWDLDAKTEARLQYYRLSDDRFLKDYFPNAYDKDSSPDTFFLLTRRLSKGVLSFQTFGRVNRFEGATERLPELRYDLSNQEIGNTGVYLRNTSSFVNLTKKRASPSERRQKTMRLSIDNELSYPMKWAFVDARPYVGTQQVYYSRTRSREKFNSIRGIFRTGINLSTRFFRVFDVHTDTAGLNINRLRHIVTPSVGYAYQGAPTMRNDEVDQFDGIDSLTGNHSITFSLENKLQTKRFGKAVDLLRFILTVPFYLKESASKGGFGQIKADIDFRPWSSVSFYLDSIYDTVNDRLSTVNFDLYINGRKGRWYANIGKRWHREADDQLTTELFGRLNPKWAAKTYTRFDLRNGILKEQQFTVTRDLHAWELDVNFNETRGQGSEIWMIFRLKAFPDMALDVGTSFNKRKAGSQSSGGKQK